MKLPICRIILLKGAVGLLHHGHQLEHGQERSRFLPGLRKCRQNCMNAYSPDLSYELLNHFLGAKSTAACSSLPLIRVTSNKFLTSGEESASGLRLTAQSTELADSWPRLFLRTEAKILVSMGRCCQNRTTNPAEGKAVFVHASVLRLLRSKSGAL